jgi:hypothetical protein
VGQLLAARAVGLAAAVLVVFCHGGVVVARHARDPPLPYQGHDLVRPGGVAYEVPEVVGSVHVVPAVYVGQHRLERRQVAVDV